MEARERRERGEADGDVHGDGRGHGGRARRIGDARAHEAAAEGEVSVRHHEVGRGRGVVIAVAIEVPLDFQQVGAELRIKGRRRVEHDVLTESRDDGQRGDKRLRRAVERGLRENRRLRRVPQSLPVEDGEAVAVRALGVEIGNQETRLDARAGEREFIGHHEALVRLPRQQRGVQGLIVRGEKINLQQAVERRDVAAGLNFDVRRDQVRDGPARVEERIHVQRERRGVGEAARVVRINFRIEHPAQSAEAEAHEVAVEVFVVAEIQIQAERLAEIVQPQTERGRTDAAERLALEPRERHVLRQREGTDLRHHESVVIGGVRVEGGREEREPVAAADGPAARRARGRFVMAEAKAAADRAVRLLAMRLGNEPPHLSGRPDGQARRLHRADHAPAVNVRAQKRVGLGKFQFMNERRDAIRLGLIDERLPPEAVYFHLVGEPLLVAHQQLLQRRDGVRLPGAILRHEIRDADERVAGERADINKNLIGQRGVSRAVGGREDHGEQLRVAHGQHRAGVRRVGEGTGNIRRGVQLQRTKRAAGKNRRGRGPCEERHSLAAEADVEKIRACDGEEVRQVIRRERDREQLCGMRGENRVRWRMVSERAGHARGGVQLCATERRALLDGRGRGPRHDRRAAGDVDEDGAAGREEVRRIVGCEQHGERLRVGDAQHRAGGRDELERAGGVDRGVELRGGERGAVDDGRGVRPGDGRRRRSHGNGHALRGDVEAREIVGCEHDREQLCRARIENRSR